MGVHKLLAKFHIGMLRGLFANGQHVHRPGCVIRVGVEPCFLQISTSALLVNRHHTGRLIVQITGLRCA